MELSELKDAPGMGVVSAFMIKLIAYIMSCPKPQNKKRIDLSKFSHVCDYSQRLFAASDRELCYVLYLDKRMGLVEKVKVAEGGEWQIGVLPRDILGPAFKNNSASFIVIHNHPHGEAKPSHDDINFTVRLEAAANSVGIIMAEHMIYADGRLYPIMKSSKIKLVSAIEYDEV